MFHSFFQFSSKVHVLNFLFAIFQFYSDISRQSKIYNSARSLFFLLTIIRFDRQAEIRWSVCTSKSESFPCLILQDKFWVVHIPFLRMVKLQFLIQFHGDYFLHPVVPSLIPSCANLTHSLIMWFIVSSPSPHKQHFSSNFFSEHI